MYNTLNEEFKNKIIENLTANLSVLRTMLHLTQAQLAELMGVSRQTIMLFETGKRQMTWSTFIGFLFIFENNESTKPLIEALEICPKELKMYIKNLGI